MFFYVLILVTFSSQQFHMTGEGQFPTEAACQKAADTWRAHAVPGIPMEPICVETRR